LRQLKRSVYPRQKAFSEVTNSHCPLKKIGVKTSSVKFIKKGWLIATVILFLLSIGLLINEKAGGDGEKNAFVVYLILGIVTGIITLFTYKRFFYLANHDNQNAIEFLLNKPSKQELQRFIDELIDC
jgi:hypothetical protein